ARLWIVRDFPSRWRREEVAATLLDVSQAITGARLELWEMVERVQKRTCEALGCDAVGTFWWDKDRSAYRLASHYPPHPDNVLHVQRREFRPDEPLGHSPARMRTPGLNRPARPAL